MHNVSPTFTLEPISTKDLDIKLYSDVDARMNGYYTMENIPPKFISILPEEEYRKHWEKLLIH